MTNNQNDQGAVDSNKQIVTKSKKNFLIALLFVIGVLSIITSIFILLLTINVFSKIGLDKYSYLIGIIGILFGFFGITNERIREKIKKLDKKISWIHSFFLVSIILLLLTCSFSILYTTTRIKPDNELIVCVFPNGEVQKIPNILFSSDELNTIFPQISTIPFSHTQIYASNGKTTSLFHNGDRILDRRKYYTEINFRNYCDSSICNSGWMIGPLMGYNASLFSSLSFYTRGAHGNENFGVKIKDTKGNELSVNILDYAENHQLGTQWQKISIPFDHFVKIAAIDTSSLDIITLYSDGTWVNRDPETIYVADFRFE